MHPGRSQAKAAEQGSKPLCQSTRPRAPAAHPVCAKPLEWDDPVTEVLSLGKGEMASDAFARTRANFYHSATSDLPRPGPDQSHALLARKDPPLHAKRKGPGSLCMAQAFTATDQLRIVSAIIDISMPGGAAAFLDAVEDLFGAEAEQAASTPETAIRAKDMTFDGDKVRLKA